MNRISPEWFASDLARIVSMEPGETYAPVLFDASEFFERDDHVLFTVVMLTFRDRQGGWSIQLLEAQESCPETHPYSDPGNVFEYWGEHDPSANGGFTRYATTLTEVENALTIIYGKIAERNDEMRILRDEQREDRQEVDEKAESRLGVAA